MKKEPYLKLWIQQDMFKKESEEWSSHYTLLIDTHKHDEVINNMLMVLIICKTNSCLAVTIIT